jgi:succinate-acetate transporter protein
MTKRRSTFGYHQASSYSVFWITYVKISIFVAFLSPSRQMPEYKHKFLHFIFRSHDFKLIIRYSVIIYHSSLQILNLKFINYSFHEAICLIDFNRRQLNAI